GQSPATKDQRIRAGLIDHFIDSTLWFWLFIIAGWSIVHLEVSVDARSFLVMLATNFPISISIFTLLFLFDFLLCVTRGQSIGQLINGIRKSNQRTTSHLMVRSIFDTAKIWLHGLISRCLGMPLLYMCLIIGLIFNPIIKPIDLHDFSLIEPEGSFLLMVFLFKIIGWTLLLFGLFLPFGLGFIREQLPTWYDQLLGVHIVENPQK
ncbi:MAG TPA: hypothetical protein VIH30_07040, partial [Aquirhabdus sp.]